MPELPEVESFRRVADECRGRTIDHASVADPAILDGISPRDLEQRLKGQRVRSSKRHGKRLIIELSGSGALALHFGMNGSLELVREGEPDPPYTRFELYFERDGRLAYINPRRLGGITLSESADAFIAEAGLGPDVISDEFNSPAFNAILASSKRDIKVTLMDQSLMAGIGNIYSDEILFQARILPGVSARELCGELGARLFRTMRTTLAAAIASGGGTEQGSERLPKWFLATQRRRGGICPRCQGPLAAIKKGGRMSFYCQRCQTE